MCGIAGYVQHGAAATRHNVERQLATLRHRGPDAEGAFIAGRGAIGQTRLSIIDLVTGDPPIVSGDGHAGVVLNGEIYNYERLRHDLVRQGAHFATTGDTEVVGQLAWREDDPVAMAQQLDGMFAFAVWDTRRDRLILGRDRFGKKPLHYWCDGKTFVFGSEIKAVLAHPAVPREVDPSVIPAYLGFGYVPTPRTFYRGVLSVPAGHIVVVGRNLQVELREFWRPPLRDRHDTGRRLNRAEASGEVLAALGTAVRKRLIADVPVGAFLSGGVDSSAVVALMAEATTAPVPTFTIGFDDATGFDERPHARLVAERFGTDHTEFVVTPDAVSLVDQLVDAHDQPFGDSSAVPTYLLSELTREHVTVALCGDGGDELFVGYERFLAGVGAGVWSHVPAPARSVARSATAHLPGRRGARVARLVDTADLGLPDAFRRWISFVPDDVVAALCPDDDGWGIANYRTVWERSAGAATLDRLVDLTLRTYLLDELLPKVDRTSMAHALEVRAPFLDHELAELALRLPGRTRIRHLRLKSVLKDALRGTVPDLILDRPKHGFGLPLGQWFREDLARLTASTLGAPGAEVRSFLVGPPLDRLLEEHRTGRTDHGHALWSLLTLELFLRRERR
jgi:asparagine synthase (glutamine-hydrolysing)